MEARKKKATAKKIKRKPSAESVLAAKAIIEEKIKLYSQKGSGLSIAQEPEAEYLTSAPEQAAAKANASSNKEIEKKLKALKDLIGLAPGLWREDAQKYVNRLRDNDRY